MDELSREMERWERAGLRRTLVGPADGRQRIDFVSNDYLGLARDPAVIEAARAALETAGAGGRGSRLLGGGSAHHEAAEEACGDWLGAESALLFPSGFQANLGVVGALVGRGDAVFSDARNHASLIDAARLSRAQVFVHGHFDFAELGDQLARARSCRRRLVLTEGVFSMDGDAPDLVQLATVCREHAAWLVVDEAHAVGLIGPQGSGAWRASGAGEQGLADVLVARVVTGGKALGGSGAFVCGSAALREHLINRARSFVFTTAPAPATAAALQAAIERARTMDAERAHVRDLAERLATHVWARGARAAIVPVRFGAPDRAVAAADELQEAGFDVRAVRPPTVPEGQSGLRVVLHAHNTRAEVDALASRLPQDPAPTHVIPTKGEPLFVVGTDTGIGKTVVAALLLRAARGLGAAAYWKPVQTGTDCDTATVGALAAAAVGELLPPGVTLPLPASPHEAAIAAGTSIDPASLEAGLEDHLCAGPDRRLIVELAGGLLVPYRIEPDVATQADWLARRAPPLVLVARSGLGTLNHTMLTIEALQRRHLVPRALVLVGDPHPSNRATLAQLSGVPLVFELPHLADLGPEALERWLDANDCAEVFQR